MCTVRIPVRRAADHGSPAPRNCSRNPSKPEIQDLLTVIGRYGPSLEAARSSRRRSRRRPLEGSTNRVRNALEKGSDRALSTHCIAELPRRGLIPRRGESVPRRTGSTGDAGSERRGAEVADGPCGGSVDRVTIRMPRPTLTESHVDPALERLVESAARSRFGAVSLPAAGADGPRSAGRGYRPYIYARDRLTGRR